MSREEWGKIIILGLLLFLLSYPLAANAAGLFGHPAVWGRSAFWGSAFVAVADDAGTLYWNPAGLSQLPQRYQLGVAHGALFNGFGLNHQVLTLARSDRLWGIGVGMDRLGTEEILEAATDGSITGKLDYREARASMALAHSFVPLYVWGRSVKFQLGFRGTLFNVNRGQIQHYAETRRYDMDYGLGGGMITTFGLYQGAVLRLAAAAHNLASSLAGQSAQTVLGAALVQQHVLGLRRLTLAAAYRAQQEEFVAGVEGKIGLVGLGVALEQSKGIGRTWRLGLQLGTIHFVQEERPYLGSSHRIALQSGWGRYRTPLSIQHVALYQQNTKKSMTEVYASSAIEFQIEIPEGVVAADIYESELSFLVFNNAGKEVVRIDAKDLEFLSGKLIYRAQPIEDWLQQYLLARSYAAVTRLAGSPDHVLPFTLSRDPLAVELVQQAYEILRARRYVWRSWQDMYDEIKELLIAAVAADRSYPNAYYVAALTAELYCDFTGARHLYRHGADLSGGKELLQAGQTVDLQRLATSYLDQLSGDQEGGLDLAEQLLEVR